MITEKINLKPPYENHGIDGDMLSPTLTCMLHDSTPESRHPAIVVVPGGSYSRCSKREGEPTAARFYAFGYNAFVLEYSCVNKKFPTALLELGEAVRYIRDNADRLMCDGRIVVCGFSAGGHLAASLGVYHGELAADFGNVRPDAEILCYPVITSGEYTHRESAENIAPTAELTEKISLERHVSGDFPPAFIWHCADDDTVPVENSLMLAAGLSANKVPFALHVFPEGGHGIALCDITTVKDDNPRYVNSDAAQWFELALGFLERMGIGRRFPY